MRRVLTLSAVAALLFGCAAISKKDSTVCAEYRGIICATAPECSMDQTRGCRVCQCSPGAADVNGNLPTGVAPDRR
jgi:hypothetical protein